MLHCARKQGKLMSVGSKEARRILAYPKSVPACIPAATDETLLRGVGAQCTDAHLLELHAKPLPLLHRSVLKSGVHTNISLNRNWARQGRKRNAAFHTGQKKGKSRGRPKRKPRNARSASSTGMARDLLRPNCGVQQDYLRARAPHIRHWSRTLSPRHGQLVVMMPTMHWQVRGGAHLLGIFAGWESLFQRYGFTNAICPS